MGLQAIPLRVAPTPSLPTPVSYLCHTRSRLHTSIISVTSDDFDAGDESHQYAPWDIWSVKVKPRWEAFAEEVEHTLRRRMRVAKVSDTHVYVGMPFVWMCSSNSSYRRGQKL